MGRKQAFTFLFSLRRISLCAMSKRRNGTKWSDTSPPRRRNPHITVRRHYAHTCHVRLFIATFVPEPVKIGTFHDKQAMAREETHMSSVQSDDKMFEEWQQAIWRGPGKNRCARPDDTGGTKCKLVPGHDGDHDYRLETFYVCKQCGSLVLNKKRHKEWHEEIRCSCSHGLTDEYCPIHGDGET